MQEEGEGVRDSEGGRSGAGAGATEGEGRALPWRWSGWDNEKDGGKEEGNRRWRAAREGKSGRQTESWRVTHEDGMRVLFSCYQVSAREGAVMEMERGRMRGGGRGGEVHVSRRGALRGRCSEKRMCPLSITLALHCALVQRHCFEAQSLSHLPRFDCSDVRTCMSLLCADGECSVHCALACSEWCSGTWWSSFPFLRLLTCSCCTDHKQASITISAGDTVIRQLRGHWESNPIAPLPSHHTF